MKSWREALNDPGLPVVTVQLNRYFGPPDEASDRGWSQLREAQRQVPKRLEGVAVVPTFDLSLTDGIHISPGGNLLLGERMARAALAMVHGHPIDSHAPDLRSATRVDDGAMIELTFDAVSSRIDTIDRQSNPFVVEDESGRVSIAEVIYPGDRTLRLRLDRKLQGEAKVHGGYGFNPPIMPMDMERVMPLLGFCDAPVV